MGFMKVKGCGTGIMLIKRAALTGISDSKAEKTSLLGTSLDPSRSRQASRSRSPR